MIIKSRQDTYQYTHDQKQAGFSADVGFDGKPQSFSINGSKTNVDTDHAQGIHQIGIKAQESTLQVQGKSEFTGGYFITDQGKNQTQFAQGIQTQDIQNHLNYEGDAISPRHWCCRHQQSRWQSKTHLTRLRLWYNHPSS